ncbi:MAG: hypothetical protein NWR52_07080, partial [Paracoccaceae bacterium]|nr:hypothetical protein [Paracoccaceae bacterium]
MFLRRIVTAAALVLALPAFAATLGDDGLHKTDWMRDTFKTEQLSAALCQGALEASFVGPWASHSAATLLIRECLSGDAVVGGRIVPQLQASEFHLQRAQALSEAFVQGTRHLAAFGLARIL